MRTLIHKEREDFIIKNYRQYGARYCAEKLGITMNNVYNIRYKLKIHLTKDEISRIHRKSKYKENTEFKVNADNFFHVTTPEIAYLLGFIWADGYIGKNRNIYYQVRLTCVKPDFNYLYPILKKTGNWNIYESSPKNRQKAITGQTTNRVLSEFLVDKGYSSKSEESANKILQIIPDNLKRYWFLGLIDGDGCFYINQKNKCYQFGISSSYNQNWDFVENLLKQLNIRYSVNRYIKNLNNKINKYSVIRCGGIKNIQKLFNYLYPNGYEFGFKRKFDKAKLIIEQIN